MAKPGTNPPTAKAQRLNLPIAYWYEIWSQVIARAWSALGDVEAAAKKAGLETTPGDLPEWLCSDEGKKALVAFEQNKEITAEAVKLLSGFPNTTGEDGRKEIGWSFLRVHGFVAGEEPLNFPKLHLELLKDGEKESEAKYMAKNAFRNINGWAQDLIELGGKATIKIPGYRYERERAEIKSDLDERLRARALDWYVKQGLYMPFAPNNRGPFSTIRPVTSDVALGFSGGRVGEETLTEGLNGDAAWAAVFPQILASVWNDPDQAKCLVQFDAKKDLEAAVAVSRENREIRKIRERMLRARDALFAQFGYGRPVGLEIDFELVEAKYKDAAGWDDTELQPELVVRIPPPPRKTGLHAIALADYRATGKAQLFTT